MGAKMKLRIVGSGCSTCRALFDAVKKTVEEENIDAEVEYVTDIKELIEAGAMGSPGLFKNGKLVAIGMLTKEQIMNLINANYP